MAEQWELLANTEEATATSFTTRKARILPSPDSRSTSRTPTKPQLLPSEGRNKGEPLSGRTNGSSAPGFHDPLDWVP
jgi:hypothetical protein